MKNQLLIFSICIFFSCTDKSGDWDSMDPIIPGREIAEDVDLIYSDSARIQFRIITPRMETFMEEDKVVEEYPNGLHIDFYNRDNEIISSIRANYARRVGKEGKMTLKDEVELVNESGDKLITTGIQWDELNHTLKTSKFVQLIKVSEQDTFFGFGFEAKDDFSKFRITQLSGKRRYQNLTRELGLDEGK